MTEPALKLPTLVDCAPYGARLTETACAKRHRRAKRLSSALSDSSCRTCPTGAHRAARTGVRGEGLNRSGYEVVRHYTDEMGRACVSLRCGCGVERWCFRSDLSKNLGKVCFRCMRKHEKAESAPFCRRVDPEATREEAFARGRRIAADRRRLRPQVGERLGCYTIEGEAPRGPTGRTQVVCRCVCGALTTKALAALRHEPPSRCRRCPKEAADAAE